MSEQPDGIGGVRYDRVVHKSVAAQIADNLRQAIVEGRLAVDQRLPTEGELAERFSVSRPTVREALKRLAAQNLIRSRRGPAGGNFVKRPSVDDVHEQLTGATTMLVSMGAFELDEIAEARHELEGLCCRLALNQAGEDDFAVMAREIEIQREDISDEAFCASDVRFHRALADATGNGVLRLLMSAVIEALQPLANMVIARVRERGPIVEQHERLLAALRAGDTAAAQAAVDEQMRYLREQYALAREPRQAGGGGSTHRSD